MHRRTVLTSLAFLPTLANSEWAFGAMSQNIAPLTPPSAGDINVAFLLSEGATVIDFCGPWEVFQDVAVGGPHTSPDHRMPFRLYTVAESRDTIRATGGLHIVPEYTLQDAPAPRVVVIPAQGGDPDRMLSGHSDRMLDWIRTSTETADVTLSVCLGAFVLASTGLLKGRGATTHHDFYDRFARQFPDVELRRGLRFVEQGKLMTAGGLSSGIDAALRIVERYFGRDVARYTATYMEYQGTGWIL
jgi:transcriptional regulator GlxA family with amidase domain